MTKKRRADARRNYTGCKALCHKAAYNAFHILVIHNPWNGIARIAFFQRSGNERRQILFFYHVKGGRDIHIGIELFNSGNKLHSLVCLR